MDHRDMTCQAFREELPVSLAAGGELSGAMARHRDGCEPCRLEEAMLQELLRLRPEPPAALAGTISAALRSAPAEAAGDAGRHRPGGWGAPMRMLLPAAALLVAALGTVLLRGGSGAPSLPGGDPPTVAAVDGLPAAGVDGMHLWPSANGMVAGEPLLLLDGLSEEQLEALLEEMEG